MLIEDALREATDAQIKSEWARRTQAMRKTRGGGRKPTSDLSTVLPRYIRKPADVPNMVKVRPDSPQPHYYVPTRFRGSK